jgi:hypothetical protein
VESIIQNPAMQSGVFPFALSLAVVLAFSFVGRFRAGLAVAAGLALAIWLAAGFQIIPLTSTRKIVLLSAAAFAVGFLVDLWRPSRRTAAITVGLLAAAAALWMLWPVLVRRELLPALALGGALALYAGWQTAALTSHAYDAPRALGGSVALAFGTGISALFGASALLGQLGMALGAAAAAPALVQLIRGGISAGHALTLPAAAVSAWLGVAAYVYAKLPWSALLALALVPLLAAVPWPRTLPDRVVFVLITLLATSASALAVYLTWLSAGGVPL